MSDRPANRLAQETSPYLLQHAHNPVDWYPWGPEALERARAEGRPILLSIGYAACHWCHVMERESFEDETTAALMNEHFVSIKVDREERPDLDSIYMDAVQAMNGHGGWPLTAFLTPDGEPFYAGTYYPPEPRHGMPAFRQVLTGIAGAWRDRRDEVSLQGSRIVEHIARAASLTGTDAPLTDDIAVAATDVLRRSFDERWGGFGGAPKFPQPMVLEFLLRRSLRDAPGAAHMVSITLDRMADGGIYDHLGGGFARYATDISWLVPHFEKMLYDNAQLLRLYTRAWQTSRTDPLARVVIETADYLLREMQHPDGGFFSSQDADSEGVEGRFFTWTWDQLAGHTGEHVAACLGARPEGNWEGTNVLWRPFPPRSYAAEHGLDPDELETQVEEARRLLFELRRDRIHPGTDDKILAAWNGLAIDALAEAGRAFGNARYVEAAERAASFVLTHLRDDRGRLRRSWRNEVVGPPAFADDHALMGSACLTLYETTGDVRWFVEARALADELLRLFHDERGGFFQTGTDAEALVLRPKDLYDNAVPGGNSAAAALLLRLALFTGEAHYERAGIAALRLIREAMGRAPTGFGLALCALDLHLGPAREVAVVGDPHDPATRALVRAVTAERWLPNVVVAAAAPGGDAQETVPLLRDRGLVHGRPAAYVCERFACRLPVT
ncbi:MAG: thioredoxin domain-containing protein, partial [Actinobacteria bacterium]|nr:thioredoxin domain-containing protein [Actinomycetota bacterium]